MLSTSTFFCSKPYSFFSHLSFYLPLKLLSLLVDILDWEEKPSATCEREIAKCFADEISGLDENSAGMHMYSLFRKIPDLS